ncbi:hypothetical protein AWB77_02482 [Caballeronia fortuita]|uniref:Uncharacterized protein n=1 Tax=Caballeronia fortuita TaxID=1777138 RepID=A0A158B613_9BURK|nr:hypothetical protein [Caballeronia fortuita]SAK65439.1 hypothetical protein AWB77_02482 [Caballeronia fortuita]
MSTPQVKAPTKKAFHFPKSADDKAPDAEKPKGKTRTKTQAKAAATPETRAKAAAPETTSNPSTKKPAAKTPAVKKVAKTAVESQPKTDAKAKRVKKEKVVRDSFTMPKSDYAKIAALKDKCQKNGVRVKKSELLRAALAMLDAAPEKRLVEAIKALETVKTGRPANT